MTGTRALRELFLEGTASVTFANRAEPIPGDLRLSWRLVVLCMILDRSWGGKATMQTAHVLWWAIRSGSTRTLFLRWLDGNQDPDEILVRFDPALNETMDLAIGAGLVELDKNLNLVLTATGKNVAFAAFESEDVLRDEKQFLAAFPTRITSKSIRQLLEWK